MKGFAMLKIGEVGWIERIVHNVGRWTPSASR